jgi:hypothetical protein
MRGVGVGLPFLSVIGSVGFAIVTTVMLINFGISRTKFFGRVGMLFIVPKILLMPLVGLIIRGYVPTFPASLILWSGLCWLGDVFCCSRNQS